MSEEITTNGGASVERDVNTSGGHFIGRDYVTNIISPPPNHDHLLKAYLNQQLKAFNHLALASIDPNSASDAESKLALNAVYTALMTRGGEGLFMDGDARGKRISPSALAQLNRHKHLVLLGDPGSGKSTFVNFVGLCMAGEMLGDKQLNLARLTTPLPDEQGQDQEEAQPWDHGALLPVRVILRDFAARGMPLGDEAATAEHLVQFIKSEVKQYLPEYADWLCDHLHKQGGLILLDGLDEISEANAKREQLKTIVEQFSATYCNCRILVTSRIYAYQKPEWKLADFAEATLSDFSLGQIRRFVQRWYEHIGKERFWDSEDTQAKIRALQQAIDRRDRLQTLAEKPILLTLMASLHAWHGRELPERREELYDEAVDLLLHRWDTVRFQEKHKEMPLSLAEWLKSDRNKVRHLLNHLAFEAHKEQAQGEGNRVADIPADKVIMGLWRLNANKEANERQLINYLSQRAGLLLPHGEEVFTFPHRTFQEYLAACYLTDHEYPTQIGELAREDPNRWREVTALAGAKAMRGAPYAMWGLVEALCFLDVGDPDATLADFWGAQLAGEMLAELLADPQHLGRTERPKLARVKRWLLHILRGDQLPASERAIAGNSLAMLGDERAEVMSVDAMPFCYVPAGPFRMGSDEALTSNNSHLQTLFDSEKPCHEVTVGEYWLAQYPVTNAQYAQFVADGGYGEASYWPEAIQAGVWRDGQIRVWTWNPEKRKSEQERSNRPHDYGSPFNLLNHPVVGVSWYEAVAFCRWLTHRWADQLAGWQIQLPSEAQWEKGVRGGREIPTEPVIASVVSFMTPTPIVTCVPNPQPERQYAWGEHFDGERANAEGEIGATNSVGCFGQGRTLYGCEEMLGNVWEWTRTAWGKGGEDWQTPAYRYPYDASDGREDDHDADMLRMLRGGSWSSNSNVCRAAYRDLFRPNSRSNYLGFRVVRVPPSLDR